MANSNELSNQSPGENGLYLWAFQLPFINVIISATNEPKNHNLEGLVTYK